MLPQQDKCDPALASAQSSGMADAPGLDAPTLWRKGKKYEEG